MCRCRDLLPAFALLLLGACGPDVPATAPGPLIPSFIVGPGHVTVNSLADPGDGTCDVVNCTLREAVNDPSVTEIGFAKGLSGVITLDGNAGTLVVDRVLSIVGPDKGITIQRRSDDPVSFRIFNVGLNGVAMLKNLTIQGGRAVPPDANTANAVGGGILNRGSLTLVQCRVTGNTAPQVGQVQGFAGGIQSSGSLTLVLTTVSGNSAISGGGISATSASLDRSTVSGNSGGGISARTLTMVGSTVSANTDVGVNAGDASISGSTISENAVAGILLRSIVGTISNSVVSNNGGPGIFIIADPFLDEGRVTITNTAVVGNSSAEYSGGIHAEGAPGFNLEVANSTISGNEGAGAGGIDIGGGGWTLVINSTISGNRGARGGGIALRFGETRLTNSTISGNSAANGGGGMFVLNGLLDVVNSTFASNVTNGGSGGGLEVSPTGAARLTNSLLALNAAPSSPDLANSGGLLEAAYTLVAVGDGSGLSDGVMGNRVGSLVAPLDANLAPLANNGGPTLTHALKPGSPAIDAASTPLCPLSDQRGVARPQGLACDMGSYERSARKR